jgi:hypothetical protein
MRTEDHLGVDRALASWTQRQVVQILEQVLLFQCTLKRLVQCLFWSQDEVQQQPGNKEQYHEKRREYLRKDAAAPGLNIAKRPSNERKPDRDEVCDPNRKQELGASRGGFDHEPFPLGDPITANSAVSLSVPDTLEPSDRKHEYTGAARTLLSRTRDPEFRLPSERAQRLDASHTPPGSGPDNGQDVTHLIIVDPDDQCGQSCASHCRVALDLRCRRTDRRQIRQQWLCIGRLDYCQDQPHPVSRLETLTRDAPGVVRKEPM